MDLGAGDDYVYAFLPCQSQFLGGSGVDTAFLHGTFRDWSYEVIDANGGGLDLTTSNDAQDYTVWTVGDNISSTARLNVVRGIEFLQFNDILLDLGESLSLSGPASVVEGTSSAYVVRLAGDGLERGQSVAFSLRLNGITASPGADFGPLLVSSVSAGPGVRLDLLPDTEQGKAAPGVVTVVATANQARSSNALLATVMLPTTDDAAVESSESFSLSLSGFITPTEVTTTITDNDVASPVQPPTQTPAQPPGPLPPSGPAGGLPGVDPVELSLSGRGKVREGRSTKNYSVRLGSGALAAGDSVTFQLRSQGRSARLGKDFDALTARRLRAGQGMRLGAVASRPDGLIEVTATNISGQAQRQGSTLASFRIKTRQDRRLEGKETFRVDLSSSTFRIGRSRLVTAISDDDRRPRSGPVTPAPTAPSPAPCQPARLPPGTFGDNFVFGRGGFGEL